MSLVGLGLLLRGFGASGSALPGPDTPVLAVADDADNTGATATITASTSGSENIVFTRAVSGGLGTSPWVSSGNRTGNGTVSLNLAAGYYMAYVQSTLNSQQTVSNQVYFVVTTGADAVLVQCLDGVLARLQGMTFAGITNSNFSIRKLPWNRKLTSSEAKPGAFISPVPVTVRPQGGNNVRDERGYGVAVVVARISNENLTSDMDATILWRQQIDRAFLNQRLDAVVENTNCTVEPGSIFNAALFGENYDVFSMTVRCWCLETRGLS